MKNLLTYKQAVFVSYLLFFLLSPEASAKGLPDSLFLSDDVLYLEIRTDFKAILKDRSGDAVYQEGEIRYPGKGNGFIAIPVRVAPRGNFRLKPENCSFPPLLLNFKKEDVKNTLFDKQDKLKLVTPCREEKEVIEEYIIYRMYQEVTHLSLKVRLAVVRYIDAESDSLLFTGHSFFIEDKERAAKRLGATVYDKMVTPFDLDHDSFRKLAFFQFMIGNKDWYVSSRHNIIIMMPDNNSEKPFAVPFDFDFSGMINAAYTKAKGSSPEPSPARRLYKGLCYTSGELEEVFKFFRQLKPKFISLVKESKLISRYDKNEITDYISYFYYLSKSKSLIKEEITDKCETKALYNIPEK